MTGPKVTNYPFMGNKGKLKSCASKNWGGSVSAKSTKTLYASTRKKSSK